MSWPKVLDEDDTLDLLLAGKSIARFGDGEFRLLEGNAAIAQEWHPRLQHLLKQALRSPGECIIGIPRLDMGPKKDFWGNFRRFDKYLNNGMIYGSAFITRPDSATWIDQANYWQKIRKLWINKDIILVRGSDKSLTKDMLSGAKDVQELIAPAKNAYSSVDELSREILASPRHSVIILCLGPAATVMAHVLSETGRQCLDLGHLGMFLRKHERGEPMRVTEADKAIDRGH